MMPTLFIGHGSPMNILEQNEYVEGWKEIASSFPRPRAILSVSAHWFTDRTSVFTGEHPRTIHDFYGFPPALYEVEYPAPGSPEFANKALALLSVPANDDSSWGLDHGTWCVLHAMYPKADIPVFQISINQNASPKTHFSIGRSLAPLRGEDVLLLGSGNIVHNLSMVDFSMQGGFDWAYEFDEYIGNAIQGRADEYILEYQRAGKCAEYAFHSPDHFYPLLYTLGASDAKDSISVFNHSCMAGSLSMTSYIFSK